MGVSVYKVPRRLYWTSDRARLVPHGDDAAAFLAFPAGAELSLEEARRYRLLDTLDTPVVAEKMVEAPRNKMRGRPPGAKTAPVAPGSSVRVEDNVIEP